MKWFHNNIVITNDCRRCGIMWPLNGAPWWSETFASSFSRHLSFSTARKFYNIITENLLFAREPIYCHQVFLFSWKTDYRVKVNKVVFSWWMQFCTSEKQVSVGAWPSRELAWNEQQRTRDRRDSSEKEKKLIIRSGVFRPYYWSILGDFPSLELELRNAKYEGWKQGLSITIEPLFQDLPTINAILMIIIITIMQYANDFSALIICIH